LRFRKLFPYAGGQKNLLPILTELLPHHTTYTEVFGGGCTLLLNKLPSDVEVYNDLDKRLVNLFLAVKDHPEEFKRQLALLPNSRELFSKFKAGIKTEPDEIKRAVMWYYLLLNTWSGKSGGGTFVTKTRNTAKIENLEWFSNRMRHVVIENLDFEKLIDKYDSPDTLFFLDPPYYEITNLYEYSFEEEDHVRLARALKSIQGLFLLTYNAHSVIEMLYRWAYAFEHETSMTMSATHTRTREKHYIIANYDIIDRHFRPFTAKYFTF
jgi:DNA adenine methylase